jgi:hypothetical protein
MASPGNGSDRSASDLDIEITQSTMNACVAPIGIPIEHPHNGLPELRRSRNVHFCATRCNAIKTSEYAIMNNSGHFPYDEEPERYRQVIEDFTRRCLD